jgi:hypothetical protein
MVENIKDTGKMVNNMEKEFTLVQEIKKKKENGKKEKELDGLKKKTMLQLNEKLIRFIYLSFL